MDRIDTQFYKKICLNSDFLMFGPYEFLNLRNYIFSHSTSIKGIKCFGSIYIGDACLDVMVEEGDNCKGFISMRISIPGANNKLVYLVNIDFKLPFSTVTDYDYPQFIRIVQTKAARINNDDFRFHASRITDFWTQKHIHQYAYI